MKKTNMKPNFFFSSMRNKFLLLTIVFTWIPFLIICFFLYRQACISFEERIMGDMESTAQLQATRVNNLLDSYISD
ncbi:MAG: hypothetical protein WC637_12430, partial [Victivallales bacterium]